MVAERRPLAEGRSEKMNAGFDDDEFTAVDVESRGSEPNKQSNDPHTERMPRRKGDAWFWGCQNYTTCTAPTTTTPPVPQTLETLLLKQLTQAVNDRIPAKGCRHLLVKPWANGTGKRNTCQLCGAIINDKGETTGTSKSLQKKLVTDEEKHHSSRTRTVEGRTELDLMQDEVDEAKKLLEEAHVEVQAAQNKVTQAAFRVGQAMEDMAQIKKLLEANSEPAGQ